MRSGATAIEGVEARAYTIPTDQHESDGTLEWDATTMVVVQAYAGGSAGLGYTYCHPAAADLVERTLAEVVTGQDALAVEAVWAAMVHRVRNLGRPGLGAEAISAVDVALWDLKARVLDLPLTVCLDGCHGRVPVYGSGGFTSYDSHTLAEQLSGWVEQGIPRVKMKVGREPGADDDRLQTARKAVGHDVELFVDANGAYTRAQAVEWAERFGSYGVRWFEEPVTSDDLEGLRMVRDRRPGGMDVAAGEYGYTETYFERMLKAESVDCLQADVTRCGGMTGLRKVAALCDAHHVDLSGHCAPQLSAHALCTAWHLRHLEYFHDHNRIERMAFDGCLEPQPGGFLVPDRSRPGLGLELKGSDMERWRSR